MKIKEKLLKELKKELKQIKIKYKKDIASNELKFSQ